MHWCAPRRSGNMHWCAPRRSGNMHWCAPRRSDNMHWCAPRRSGNMHWCAPRRSGNMHWCAPRRSGNMHWCAPRRSGNMHWCAPRSNMRPSLGDRNCICRVVCKNESRTKIHAAASPRVWQLRCAYSDRVLALQQDPQMPCNDHDTNNAVGRQIPHVAWNK